MSKISDKDMRDAFFDELYNFGSENKDVIIMTNDMDVFSLRKFKQEFPDQYINVGVAEQNMINVAAGLSSCGKKVFVYGISSFIIFRCYEQIKFNICSMNLPVSIIGIGPGLSFSFDGPTHHGMQDIAVARALPEIEIYNPCDSASAYASSKVIFNSNCPSYIRIDKGCFPQVYQDDDLITECKIVRDLSDINIVSSGFMTHKAVEVSNKSGRKIGVIDVCRLKPFSSIMKELLSTSEHIIVLEDNSSIGGLGDIISNEIQESARIHKINLGDMQHFLYGDREWLHKEYGIDVDSICNFINTL